MNQLRRASCLKNFVTIIKRIIEISCQILLLLLSHYSVTIITIHLQNSCRTETLYLSHTKYLPILPLSPPLTTTPFLTLNLTTKAAATKSLQLCPTLCNPIDGSPPGSPIPGILQARILEWVSISFSNA